jgi:nitrite reductase/ring-hydroxylating ferredoxin subunit
MLYRCQSGAQPLG